MKEKIKKLLLSFFETLKAVWNIYWKTMLGIIFFLFPFFIFPEENFITISVVLSTITIGLVIYYVKKDWKRHVKELEGLRKDFVSFIKSTKFFGVIILIIIGIIIGSILLFCLIGFIGAIPFLLLLILWAITSHINKTQKPTEDLRSLLREINFWDAKIEEDFKISIIRDYLDNEKLFFSLTQENYLRLKERFKYSEKRLFQITQDWRDYLKVLSQIIYARNMLDVDVEENAYDRFDERVKEAHIQRDEIEKRFKNLLGKDYRNPVSKLEKTKSLIKNISKN